MSSVGELFDELDEARRYQDALPITQSIAEFQATLTRQYVEQQEIAEPRRPAFESMTPQQVALLGSRALAAAGVRLVLPQGA